MQTPQDIITKRICTTKKYPKPLDLRTKSKLTLYSEGFWSPAAKPGGIFLHQSGSKSWPHSVASDSVSLSIAVHVVFCVCFFFFEMSVLARSLNSDRWPSFTASQNSSRDTVHQFSFGRVLYISLTKRRHPSSAGILRSIAPDNQHASTATLAATLGVTYHLNLPVGAYLV